MDFQNILTRINDIVLNYGLKLIGAIVVLILGSWIIKLLTRAFRNILEKRNTDPSLNPFLIGTVSKLLWVLLIISVLGMMGIQMTAFIAVIGAVGLAVGMALSGTLQNFAGGVIILLFKPFKVGDFITAKGYTGTVNQIQIFNTVLKTPDNKTIIIPNGELSNSSLTNFSDEEKRRVDWTFGIGYGDSTEDAEKILKDLIRQDERILNEPQEPFVAVSELGDSSVNLTVRTWVIAENYWPVFFDMNRKVYNEFNKQGINIPFPQMDVHVHNNL
jgi:small conductance mechanosensitive channel